MANSALFRNPTGDFSVGDFKRNPFHYLWVKKITSSMVEDQFDCTFLCVTEPKCYSFNMAAYPDSKGLYLCELLATDKYRETKSFMPMLPFIILQSMGKWNIIYSALFSKSQSWSFTINSAGSTLRDACCNPNNHIFLTISQLLITNISPHLRYYSILT